MGDFIDFRDFLFLAVQECGHGENLIHVIKVAYTNIQSKIKLNCFLYDTFTFIGAVHSPAELLANWIDVDKKMKKLN